MITRPLVLLGLLLVGGCVLDKAPSADAPSSDKSSRASDSDEETDKPKHEQCEHTMEGNEAKTFCY